jgi:putative peptidoglycan lipid II flippase
VAGLLREQVRGYYVGTGMFSDAFGIASTIPNMLRRLFAEGAMSQAFVPVFTRLAGEEDRERLSHFYSSFMSVLMVLMVVVTALGIAFSGLLVSGVFASRFAEIPQKLELTVQLTQAMFPYLFLVSVAAIIQAALNGLGVFGPSAFAPVLMSGANILVVVLFAYNFPNPAWALCVGFLVGGVLQAIFQIPFLHRQGVRFRFTLDGFKDKHVREVFRIFLPGIFSAGIYQINVTVSQAIAASLDQGSVASLQYSLRLQELSLGVFAVSVATVILPAMSRQAQEGNIDALKETLRYSLGLLGFVTIPVTGCFLVLAKPIVTLLFRYGAFDEHSVEMTVWALYFHTAGIFFIGAYRNVVQVFYAQKDLKTPAWVAFFVMWVHVALCYLLAVPLKQGGIALAGSVAAAMNMLWLLFVIRSRMGRLGIRRLLASLARTCLATCAMSAFFVTCLKSDIFCGKTGLELAFLLIPCLLVGFGIFLLSAKLLRCQELGDLFTLVRNKLKPR